VRKGEEERRKRKMRREENVERKEEKLFLFSLKQRGGKLRPICERKGRTEERLKAMLYRRKKICEISKGREYHGREACREEMGPVWAECSACWVCSVMYGRLCWRRMGLCLSEK